jgi:SPP1 gp7 family putative phage head morphogenesis protein
MHVKGVVDPTRTTMLREKFMAEMHKRFNDIRKSVMEVIWKQDALGLLVNSPMILTANLEKQAWRFQTDSQKIGSFNEWFKGQVDAGILETTAKGEPWTAKYVDSAYKKGSVRAYIDSKKEGWEKQQPGFDQGKQAQFLESAFMSPERVEKLRVLYTRSYEDLKGISATMSQQMSRVLADGMSHGLGPAAIARNMTKGITGIEKTRARTIARTEVISAHAEGQLDSFKDLGIKELGVMVEWSVAGDDRVCDQCAAMDQAIITIEEATGLIPLHPNCRCAWIPSTKSILGEKSVFTKAEKQKQVDEALMKGLPKHDKDGKPVPQTIEEAKKRSSWLGKEKKFTTTKTDEVLPPASTPATTPTPEVVPTTRKISSEKTMSSKPISDKAITRDSLEMKWFSNDLKSPKWDDTLGEWKVPLEEMKRRTENTIRVVSEKSGISEEIVREYMSQWASGPTSNIYSVLHMQERIAKRFGGELPAFQKQSMKEWADKFASSGRKEPTNFEIIRNGKVVLKEGLPYKTLDENMDLLINTMYDQTQDSFKKAGIEKIHIWRGTKQELSEIQMKLALSGEPVPYSGNVVESWTLSKDVAEGFGRKHYMSSEVPIERVFSSSLSGLGSFSESEIVLLQGAEDFTKVILKAPKVAKTT